MLQRSPQQTNKLLELLHDAGIEFVIVGGVAAICHGSSTMTRDLDVTRPDLGIIDDHLAHLRLRSRRR